MNLHHKDCQAPYGDTGCHCDALRFFDLKSEIVAALETAIADLGVASAYMKALRRIRDNLRAALAKVRP